MLDHLILGCSDLDRGVAFVEARTGVRAAFGGVHPGRGTENALLSLGGLGYLEIMAPDPAQRDVTNPLAPHLKELFDPRLVTWAAHPGDLAVLAQKLREAKIAFEGPTPGSRERSDGLVLQWRTLMLKDNASGLLPFFIEWSADSAHPSTDSPQGCSLVRFEASTPNRDALAKRVALLGLDLPVLNGPKAQLRATIAGPKGDFDIYG
jgi:catechol 2,3-dioxygenase-like lactoylglutathione lyase family enzyme